MDNTSKLEKIGKLCVANGKYEKNGKEKNRYHDVGTVFATPHYSRLVVKFHTTAFTDEKWASVFYDEGKAPKNTNQIELPKDKEVAF